MDAKRFTVVVPVYNEETIIEPFYKAIRPVLDKLDLEAEIIFVNDGSTDETYAQVGALAERDPRVKCLCLSRDFGSHAAPLARLHWASGGAAVMLSVDLQDPPELVPQLVAKWQEGNYVVWAVRESRDDPC